MYGVVNEGGTGVRAHLPGVSVCGKTGTAQLASNELLKGKGLSHKMKDNAWFVGFAPCEAPEIAVAALFEGGRARTIGSAHCARCDQGLLRQERPGRPRLR